MKTTLLFLFLTMFAQAEVIKREELPHAFLEKIEFDGHTYIHYKATMYSHGDAFLHDPGCKCEVITDKQISAVVRYVAGEPRKDNEEGDD